MIRMPVSKRLLLAGYILLGLFSVYLNFLTILFKYLFGFNILKSSSC